MRKFAAALLLFAASAFAQQPKTTVLKAARMFDGKSNSLTTPGLVVITDNKITAVGAGASVPAGAQVIDLGDATLLPGFIDAHTHLTMMHSDDWKGRELDTLQKTIPEQTLDATANAKVTLMAGFTTVRDVGSAHYMDVGLRNAIRKNIVPGPRMLVSGPALSITGGHRDENYLAPQFAVSKDGVADGVDAVMKQVRENIKYGADVIKLMATGGVVSEGDNPAFAQYSPEEMKAVVKTAHGLGRRVAAYAHATVGSSLPYSRVLILLSTEATSMMKAFG